jgi:hypothetical protein
MVSEARSGMTIEILKPTGDDIDPGQPLKHYWVIVKGLPLKLRNIKHIQKCIGEQGDVVELDWYTHQWLDNHWVRAKVALPDISHLPPPKTSFLTAQESCALHCLV